MKTTASDINKLFYFMRRTYGSYWIMLFSDEIAVEHGKLLWFKRLKNFYITDIERATAKIRELYPQKPPTLDEFVTFVKVLKKQKRGLSDQVLTFEKVIPASIETGQSFIKKLREDMKT